MSSQSTPSNTTKTQPEGNVPGGSYGVDPALIEESGADSETLDDKNSTPAPERHDSTREKSDE